MKEQFINKRFNSSSLEVIDYANEIITEYEAQQYALSLRQLYYQMVARGFLDNTVNNYKRLSSILTDARLAGLVDWDAIEDRAREVTQWLINESERYCFSGIAGKYAVDMWENQNKYVEVWVEKDALSPVVERACRKRRVNLLPCKGYLSASEAYEAGQRFAEARGNGRDCYLFHLGDHDPSGLDMTRDNEERLALLSRTHEVEVERLALNMNQVRKYNPPPNPAKEKDARSPKYIAQFGRKSWELDALEPQVIEDLVTNAVEDLIDEDTWQSDRSREEEVRATLRKVPDAWFNWDRVHNIREDILSGRYDKDPEDPEPNEVIGNE